MTNDTPPSTPCKGAALLLGLSVLVVFAIWVCGYSSWLAALGGLATWSAGCFIGCRPGAGDTGPASKPRDAEDDLP